MRDYELDYLLEMASENSNPLRLQPGTSFASRLPRPTYIGRETFAREATGRCVFRRSDSSTAIHTIVTVPVSFERGKFSVDVEFDDSGGIIALVLVELEERMFRSTVSSLESSIGTEMARLPRIDTTYGRAFAEKEATQFVGTVLERCDNVLSAPQTHPAVRAFVRKEIASLVTQPPVTTTHLAANPSEQVRVVEETSLKSVVDSVLRPFKRLLQQDDLSPDLSVACEHPNARVVIHAGPDPKFRRIVYTTNSLENVWRGTYDGTVELSGFKDGSFELNLVDETRTTVQCTLVRDGDDGSSFCQFAP